MTLVKPGTQSPFVHPSLGVSRAVPPAQRATFLAFENPEISLFSKDRSPALPNRLWQAGGGFQKKEEKKDECAQKDPTTGRCDLAKVEEEGGKNKKSKPKKEETKTKDDVPTAL